MPNKQLRSDIRVNLESFVAGAENGKPLVTMMAAASKYYPHYGIANEVDFRELTPLFERVFAFNNKHFYIYKAISDPNKIGSLSCKQYRKLESLKKIWIRNGIAGRRFHEMVDSFMSQYGTMASPYKLLKRAFKENKENTRFIARFFPLEEDGKTTHNEQALIRLCDAMMCFNTGVEIRDATIQECYDLDFHGSNINGSGRRHCANSCMYGKKVGAFYDAFGAHGKMVYYRGRPVGRFLLWDLPNGKQYVDRLYVRGEYINEVLAKIDSEFTDDKCLKYPELRERPAEYGVMAIKLKNPDSLMTSPSTPYIDTFAYLHRRTETNEYYLSNMSNLGSEFRYIDTLRTTSTPRRMKCCPHCKHTYWSGDSIAGEITKGNRHKLYCTGYQPRTRELKAYLDIFRKYAPKLEVATTYAERTKFIF